MRRSLAIATALAAAMAACKPAVPDQRTAAIPQADAPAAPGEPASAPASAMAAEYAVALDLNGTEPFWAMKIRRDAISLERAGREQVLAPNPGARIEGEEAVWQSTAAGQGGVVRVMLKPGNCSNGMSDREFPYQATVEYAGEHLMGCAAPASR